MKIVEDISRTLWKLQDLPYRNFQSKLIPTVSKNTVIGVRMPELRKLSRKLMDHPELSAFLNALPHTYYEENNLHAYIICNIPDYELCIAELKHFLPYVDNWATCDSIRPKCFQNHLEELLPEINNWLRSGKTYIIRFALEMLMVWYLDEKFKPEYLDLAASVKSDEYYVKMMQAWFFATALTKQYDVVATYLNDDQLSAWVHNKAIQKATESHCITAEQKAYLRTHKRK